MRKLIGLLGLSATVLLSACGGGGGSSGATTERYTITLRADKTTLPLNTSHVGAGIGAYAPFTTTLYVHAKEGNDPIPGGEEIFGCNVAGGLNTGSLYYLDGDEDHEDDEGNPLSYRSITLGANAGGNSFHFHAGDQAGTARITCSVTDPRDGRSYSASVDITVGTATGKPASVLAITQEPGYLGTQLNQNGIRNNVVIQVFVMDDANQPVSNPSAPNLQVAIHPSSSAATGARLLSGNVSGTALQVSTVGGVGLISLSSGPSAGTILLELTADRSDNNVNNGIQDPVAQLVPIDVVNAVAAAPLSVSAVSVTAPNGALFSRALEATGGVPPYTWSGDALPAGLQLSSSGVISGTPVAAPGTYVVRVSVRDASGATASAAVNITITGQALVFTPPTITTTVGLPFSYALSASGGAAPLTWSALGTLPAGLSLSSTGLISGTTTTPGAYMVAIRVTDSSGNSVTSNVSITVNEPD